MERMRENGYQDTTNTNRKVKEGSERGSVGSVGETQNDATVRGNTENTGVLESSVNVSESVPGTNTGRNADGSEVQSGTVGGNVRSTASGTPPTGSNTGTSTRGTSTTRRPGSGNVRDGNKRSSIKKKKVVTTQVVNRKTL